MTARQNLAGLRFGRVTVIAFSRINKWGRADWLCQCDCGKEAIISGNALTVGNSRSCGCLKLDLLANRSTLHGHTAGIRNGRRASPEWRSWQSMLTRCEDPKHKDYASYGGRGIWVCDEWHDFVNFLRHMGPRPPGTTLDRICNNGGYEKSNCRWATPKEQANNRRRPSH